MCAEALIVGIGSDHGADRVGWLVVDELARRAPEVVCIRRAKAPVDLLDWLDGARWLGICDACQGSGPVGTWHRWRWPLNDLPFVRPKESHGYGLVETLKLAEQLKILPETVWLWGIEFDGTALNNKSAACLSGVSSDVARDILRTITTRKTTRNAATVSADQLTSDRNA